MSIDIISPSEVLKYRQTQKALLIDIRDKGAYCQGHIPGAISIPYDDFWDEVPALIGERTLILCCERGATSLLLGRKLSKKGYRVLSIGGGMEAWRGPVEGCQRAVGRK